MTRPAVDVIVPFSGSPDELRSLVGRLSHNAGKLPDGDTVWLADNRPAGSEGGPVPSSGGVRVVRATARRSSYHARNAAARGGTAPWLLFLDADVDWEAELLDRYFDPRPPDRIGVLGGAIMDAELLSEPTPTAAERYAVRNATMAAEKTLTSFERAPYAQTANALVRRSAFLSVGGFADGIRSGGDADLCWRLQAAGWSVAHRPGARVVHRNRRTVISLLGQKARHGAGAAWLEREHPGSFPPRRFPGLAWWSARSVAKAARAGRPGAVSASGLDVAAVWAFELGRRRGNDARDGVGG